MPTRPPSDTSLSSAQALSLPTRCFTGGFLTVPVRVGLPGVTRPAQGHTVSGEPTRGAAGPCCFLPFLLHFHAEVSTDPFGRFFSIPSSTREVKGWFEVSGWVSGLGTGASLGFFGYSNILQRKAAWGGRGGGQVGVIWLFKAGITVGSQRSRAPPTPCFHLNV